MSSKPRRQTLTSVLLMLVCGGIARGENPMDALESLVGRWECETDSAKIGSEFRWILDRRFIEHDQQMTVFGKTHNVKEIIGWDPETQSIRGWIYSRDWIATSTYSRQQGGEGWEIDVVLTRPDGEKSKKHKTLRIRKDKMMVRNDRAPLAEFLNLEFVRLPDAVGKSPAD